METDSTVSFRSPDLAGVKNNTLSSKQSPKTTFITLRSHITVATFHNPDWKGGADWII
jgi:hypothetical protein